MDTRVLFIGKVRELPNFMEQLIGAFGADTLAADLYFIYRQEAITWNDVKIVFALSVRIHVIVVTAQKVMSQSHGLK